MNYFSVEKYNISNFNVQKKYRTEEEFWPHEFYHLLFSGKFTNDSVISIVARLSFSKICFHNRAGWYMPLYDSVLNFMLIFLLRTRYLLSLIHI